MTDAELNLLKQFDTDGDGLISFPEFVVMLALLSIPETGAVGRIEWDLGDGNGNVKRFLVW